MRSKSWLGCLGTNSIIAILVFCKNAGWNASFLCLWLQESSAAKMAESKLHENLRKLQVPL